MTKQITLSLLGIISSQAAVFTTTGGSYLNNYSPDSNYSTSGSLIANSRSDDPHYDRMPIYSFDLSSYSGGYDEVTLTLSTGSSSGTFFSFYYIEDAVDTSSITWNTAVAAGIVPSTADGTVNGSLLLTTEVADYSATSTTYFDFDLTNIGTISSDSDGLFSIVVVDRDNSGATTSFHRHTAALTVVPEPTSLALLGLGGLALVTRRKR